MRHRSLQELAIESKRALIIGIGGGGDVIQAIPIGNFLRLLGVEDLLIGGVGCSWWLPDLPEDQKEDGKAMVFGPTLYDVNELDPSHSLAPLIVGVDSTSNYHGNYPAEAALANLLPGSPFVAGLTQGAVGLRDSLNEIISAREVDLIVGVDIGSDSFHDGHEVAGARSSLVDFLSLAALIQLEAPVVYALAGYGVDGEMQIEELDQRVGQVMKARGYLGAIGPSQTDVQAMLDACDIFPDPILPMVPRAAQGDFGLRRVDTYSPWGTTVRVTPMAATILFFEPNVLVNEVCSGVIALKDTRSLRGAEMIYRETLGEIPETELRPAVHFFR